MNVLSPGLRQTLHIMGKEILTTYFISKIEANSEGVTRTYDN